MELPSGLKALAKSIVQSEIDEPGCANFISFGVDTTEEEKQAFRDYLRQLRIAAGVIS